MHNTQSTQPETEHAKLRSQLEQLESELKEVKLERDDFREDLSQNRTQVARLTSLAEARASEIRDLERRLDRLQVCL